jgi:hypothetical protein
VTAVDTEVPVDRTAGSDAAVDRGIRLDRVVIGLLIGTAGVGWFLDAAGVSVPWHLLPAAAVVLSGSALLLTLLFGRGRSALITVGVVSTVLAIAVGVGVDRYAGPAGDRLVAPISAEWPVVTTISAGNVTVDLTRHPLPEVGRMQVDVGAGELVVILPADSDRIRVDAWTTAGNITVDDVKAGDGIDVRWSQLATVAPAPISVELHVGLGNIEVNHE